MVRREVGAVIGVENLRYAANIPAGPALAPDRLAQRKRGLNCGGRGERNKITRDRATIVVEDDRQPRLPGLAAVLHENVELGVIRLPDRIRRLGLGAVNQIEAVAVGLGALMRHEDQARL
jgi:hypothetical protein